MKKSRKLKKKPWKKTNKFLFWAPRALSILFIIFLSMFALDIFSMKLGFWGTIVGLFMHLIPSFILIIVTIIAWKKEKIGGIIFIILALAFTLYFETYQMASTFLAISFPVFLIGILFLLSCLNKKRTA